MAKHIIQTINFNLFQSETLLISNLNWTADESDWIEISGSNNCGKTVFLDAIFGRLEHFTGQLFVLDYSMTPVSKDDLSTIRRKTGYAKQDAALITNKTLRANLAMALNAADRITDQNFDEVIMSLLDKFSLKDLIKREINHFSTSQQIMASIAHALIHRPKLLLLDQSLDFLDSANRQKVIEIIQEYREAERMTVISTSLIGWSSQISSCRAYKIEEKNLRIH